jgi:cytochrome c biogenesis protein
VQFRPDDPNHQLSPRGAGGPPAGSYPDPDERRKQQIANQGCSRPPRACTARSCPPASRR